MTIHISTIKKKINKQVENEPKKKNLINTLKMKKIVKLRKTDNGKEKLVRRNHIANDFFKFFCEFFCYCAKCQ